jgi:hypothetical protein
MPSNAPEIISDIRDLLRKEVLLARTLPQAIQAAEILGSLNVSYRDNTLSEGPLEDALYSSFHSELDSFASKPKSIDFLHVVTDAYEYGGHTSLLLKIVNQLAKCQVNQSIFVTRYVAEGVERHVKQSAIPFNKPVSKNYGWVRDLIDIGSKAGTIVLYINPEDIAATLAAYRLKHLGCKVLFVNHADHIFSYGTRAADTVLEVSACGWELTQKYREVSNQSFLGIPISSEETIRKKDLNKAISIGSPFKYMPRGTQNFSNILTLLFERTALKLTFIGPSGHEQWWCDVKKRYGDRIKFLGMLPANETTELRSDAGVYIDSYPITGGTAFPEALMSGCTVFGLCEISGGYSLADSLRYQSLEAMVEAISTYLSTRETPERQKAVYHEIRSNFSPAAVVERLISAAQGKITPLPVPLRRANRIALDSCELRGLETRSIKLNFAQANELSFSTRLQLVRKINALSYTKQKVTYQLRLLYWALSGESPRKHLRYFLRKASDQEPEK